MQNFTLREIPPMRGGGLLAGAPAGWLAMAWRAGW